MNSFALRLTLTSVLALSLTLGTVKFYNHVSAEFAMAGLDYATISSPGFVRMEPSERRPVEVSIQNVSSTTWDKGAIMLTASYSTGELGRPSIWSGTGWEDNTTIRPTNTENILPGKKAKFNFELKAPGYAGLYKEYFKLTADSAGALNGEPLVILIQVGNPITTQNVEPKEIRIFRKSQESDIVENGYIVATLDISSGKPGYVTPAGDYRIMNKFPETYSAKYKLFMSNWMGLSSVTRGYEGYGLHSLVYWKTTRPIYPDGTVKNGRLYSGTRVYEDYNHLGEAMSHGCVRYGIKPSGVLYNWADVGTLVKVV